MEQSEAAASATPEVPAVVPPEGAFEPLAPVTIIDGKKRRFLVFPKRDERHAIMGGLVNGNDVIGALPGVRIKTTRGQVVAVYRTTLEEYVLLMPRAATVIPPKDIAYMVQWADVFPGATVVEAGIGSGGLTLGLLRAVGRDGRVIAYEVRQDHANRARKNVEAWPDTRGIPLDVRLGDIHQELANLTGVDRVLLDVPDPQNTLPAAAKALKPGGFIVAYVPGIRQVDAFILAAMAQRDFSEAEACEVMVRPWVADRQRLRPELRIVGHTGFLVRARRRGPHLPGAPELDPEAQGETPSGDAAERTDDAAPSDEQ